MHRQKHHHVGERVYFIELSQKFPLGIITHVNYYGIVNFDENDYYTVDILWDNGVTSTHEVKHIGKVADAIMALSKPTP